MTKLKILAPGDEGALEDFLAQHADTSMFLRSNYRASGLVDQGEPLQGTYVAACTEERIIGLAAHFWNGMLVVQAPENLRDLVCQVADTTGAPIRGLAGPWPQVVEARGALGLEDAPTSLCSCEDLFALDLAKLRVPTALAAGEVTCRPPRFEELDRLALWHVAYCAETLGAAEDETLRYRCQEEMLRLHGEGNHWVLEHENELVSYSAFNARLPDCVQVGGVWTPPALRRLGFARCVVAGSLLAVQAEGVARSTLFTARDNEPARRAYQALGYRIIADYGLVLLTNPIAYSS